MDKRSNGIEPIVVVLEMYYQTIKNYSYLVVDRETRRAVIVDPAWEMAKVERALVEAGATLSGVLITHSHSDHIHLADFVAERYKCPIWMSKEEIAGSAFSSRYLTPIDVDSTQSWNVGQMKIEPIFTPGHTPGSLCYLIGDNLFAGDVLFAEGCGICPDTSAAYAMFDSLAALSRRLKPETRIYPGHSYGKKPGQMFSLVQRDNIYLQFSDKQSFAAFRLRSGQNLTKMFTFS